MRVRFSGALLLLLLSAPAADAEPQVAGGKAKPIEILPLLSVSASTNGQASLQASLAWWHPFNGYQRLEIAPTVAVTANDGLGSLFSFDSGTVAGPSTWMAGASFALILRAQQPRYRQEASDADPITHPQWGLHPIHVIAIGGGVNGGGFDYFVADKDKNLTEERRDKIGGTFAVSYTHVHQLYERGGVTFEVPFWLDSGYAASPVAFSYCSPAGQVPRADGSGSDPAQSCGSGVIGAPTQSTRTFAAFEVGYVDIHTDVKDLNRPKSYWRAAIGPVIDTTSSNGTSTIEVTVQAPLYLNFNLISSGASQDAYKGIVRLTPSAGAVYDGSHWHPQVLLKLELLSDRLLFPRGLQWNR
jgi:hypothetical protein